MPNLPNLRDDREFSLGIFSPDLQETPVGKPRSRRLFVFSCVCLTVLALGLAYTVMQPAEYQATARLEITPASATTPPADETSGAKTGAEAAGGAAHGPRSFLTEVQVLTSRPLIEEVAERLTKSGDLPPDIGSDPVDGLRHMLSTETVEGTQVVLLRAEGPQRQFLARLVNSLTSVYQEHLATAYEKSTGSGADQLRDSVQALDQKVVAKRQEVDAFRSSNDIVSTERDENQLLSAAKGLGTDLNEAKGKLAAAEGQLRAVRNAAASGGQGLVAAKDNPTVADLERRASQLREELHDLQQRFTPQYLDLDPAAKATRARLDNLEQQIKTERAVGQRAAVAEAEGKVTAAREAVEQLQQQINENKSAVQTFMVRFGEFKAMQEDLTHLEQLHRAASDRLARLEASDSEVAPQVEILEAATVPQLPWRPLYARDAGISLGAAVALGFLAVWLVEFFSRPEPETAVVERRPWWPVAVGRGTAVPSPPLFAAEAARLPAPDPAPRELTDAEIAALIRATSDDGRLILMGLLSGLSAEEIVALNWDQIDLDAGAIRVSGESPRLLPLSDPLRQLITAHRALQPQAAGVVLRSTSGGPLPLDDIRSLVMYAAYDAGIEGADEVTPRTLRHTYLAYLLRQGIRLADVGRIAGRLPQEELAAYMRFAPSQPRQPLEQIELVLPAFRDIAGAA
jgi:polysaccharide biosynthesis transport protein